jgi:hypothetical protein
MRSSILSTEQVLDVFTQEVALLGGQVSDKFIDGGWLFARSVLPEVKEVRPRDRLQGGVAIKATDEQICIYPYIFRLVCSNGAITAQSVGASTITLAGEFDSYRTLESIREGIQACAAPKVFSKNVRKVRIFSDKPVDLALTFLGYVSSHSGLGSAMLKDIMDRFFKQKDQSQFGLANAVTATARDTRDPDLRWKLEELGGGILIGTFKRAPKGGTRAARALSVA